MAMTHTAPLTFKTKLSIVTAVVLWASAFVAIRAALQGGYSPGGLALMRYLIASFCMLGVFVCTKRKPTMALRDIVSLMIIGMIGIGCYNLTLNYSELTVSSGIASFIVGQSPLITTLLAVILLNERISKWGVVGLLVSVSGVALITLGEQGKFQWNQGIIYILIATVVGSFYSVLQKPYLKKYHTLEVTTYAIWGGTLSLLFYFPDLLHDLNQTSTSANWATIYLGIFPAAIGYIAWGYTLTEISASRAVTFLYFLPFVATLLGWIGLNEVPVTLSFLGGTVAILGIWIVNSSFRKSVKT